MNYYNEIDPHAAAWLRELIKHGHIADGEVDERSIEDVSPADVAGFTQCHFFAGIGGWSLALRLARWPDDKPIWTGSCPCQPFSAAGKGAGFEDERHLWPAWQHLIAQCRPSVVFGEQVASKHADAWIDLVHADLEGMGYTFGCIPFPAAGIGAPHIRDRNYWVGVGLADTNDARLEGWRGAEERSVELTAGPRGVAGRMAYANGGHSSAEREQRGGQQRQQPEDGGVVRLADAERVWIRGERHGEAGAASRGVQGADGEWERLRSFAWAGRAVVDEGRAGALHGFWRDADWLLCRDGKWRPVEPGTFPLDHGIPARVVRLRGYGNAIVPQQAAAFIEAVMDVA